MPTKGPLVYTNCCSAATGKLYPLEDCTPEHTGSLPMWSVDGVTYKSIVYVHRSGLCTVLKASRSLIAR